jgi:hypothetical protein
MKLKNTLKKFILLLTLFFGLTTGNKVFAGACTTPADITGVGTSGITASGVTFGWTLGANATHVRVQIFSNAARTAQVGANTYPVATTLSSSVAGLTCGTTYYYSLANIGSSNTGCVQSGAPFNGSFTTSACPTCTDGIQNGTETGVDCGGTCAACVGVVAGAQLCEPCSGGAHAVTNANAIDPTSGGACITSSIPGTTCAFSSSGVYSSDCGPSSMGDQYTTQYRTWYKVEVPATGIVGMQALPQAGSERHFIKSMLFTSLTCGAGTAISASTFSSPSGCSWINPSNCGGSEICGENGTLALVTDLIGAADGYGSQSYWSGLTPGTFVWICMDMLGTVGGASSPYVGNVSTCFYDSYASGSNNYIGGATTTCGGAVTGTTRSSLQGESLCAGYKPPNCGGGPAPSFENVSIFTMTADAVGSDITINLSNPTCNGSTAGLQYLIYTEGDVSGCTGTTPICGSGTCTLGSCVGGNTASGMAAKSYTITAPTPGQTFYILVDGFAGSICNFTLSSTGCVVLPVSLLDFVANKEDNKVRVNWRTGSETDNDYFLVERSFDGVDFRVIQNVDGAGNSSDVLDYEIVDYIGEYSGTVYYRLRQFDFDGKETYSIIRSTEYNNLVNEVSIMPNPSNGLCEIKYNARAIDASSVIKVMDMSGNVVYMEDHKNVKGINIVNLDLSSLKKGVYILNVHSDSGVLINKLIKE